MGNFVGSLMETPWNKNDATKVVQGSWKELDKWVYGYRAAHQERHIWWLMEHDPLNSQAIQKLVSGGWKLILADMKPGSGRCSEKEKIIARVRQNIRLCSRNKVGMVFVEGKEKRNSVLLKSLGLVLGMPTWMTKGL